MDFHSLLRRDLQFLCKKNKIPANLTNVAMADALKSLEIVEGIEEFVNKSPTSVAKQAPKTATRTTRKTTTVKAKAQDSTSKSLAGDMDQENDSKNNNVAETPAARSTRKVSCSSKVQESKKSELVQSVYNTRRSTRLLEKCMGDLSLKSKEISDDKSNEKEETEQKVSAQEENLAGSEEAEVIPSRDVRVSMEEEWKMLKNERDQEDVNVDLGDITAVDANTEIKEVMVDEKELEISIVQVDIKEEVTVQPDEVMCEEGSEKNDDDDQEIGDLEILVGPGDIPEHVTAEKSNVKKESENVLASESSVQVNQQESEYGLVQAGKQEETLQPDTPIMCEEGSKKKATDKEIGDIEVSADLSDIPVLELTDTESNNGKKESENILAFESLVIVDQQETEEVIQENDDSEAEKFNTSDEEIMMHHISGGDSETEPEEDTSSVDADSTISEAEKINMDDSETEAEEENFGVDSDSTISEAGSTKAVLGSDIAEEEMILSESAGSAAASPTLLLEEAKVYTTPFVAESISVQFPRPTTAPLKNSALKLANVDNENKENNMEMMMTVVNNTENGESKVEAKKKKMAKINEENLKDVSVRQLIKMVKQLEINSTSNRPALQILPGNDQTAE